MASRSSCLSAEPSLQDFLEVQNFFSLPSPALVEKDWHVVRALAVLRTVDAGQARLVFGGGTALSRAHRLTERMSEDIDLKIVSETPLTRPALRILRDNVTRALYDAGFDFDPSNPEHRQSGNGSRYTVYRLPYAALIAGEGALRPEIKIETAVWPLRRPARPLDVSSFWAQAFDKPAEVPLMPCADLSEIRAEKFVALTRRVGAEMADAGGPRDRTLVRHIYDLHAVRKQVRSSGLRSLILEIMQDDVEAYGHQFPAYRKDPVAETLRAVEGMGSDERYAAAYGEFVRDMVYGPAPEFRRALKTVSALADALR